ncbi:MAG: hypothetical protein DSY37_02690 [Hyperthermus sp.]|nr:MAG: hypothetical protein DSY37_02690 [Hyperthermus sp.]
MVWPRLIIVLAAGAGRRLGGAKPLVRLRGRPLAWYPLSVLHLLGAAEAVIVTRRELASGLRELARSILGRGAVNIVLNNEPWRENGYSLLLGASTLTSDASFVTMSDHVFSPLLPARLEYSVAGRGGYALVCDSNPLFIDVDEATKIMMQPPILYESSKNLREWMCVDTGVHALFSPPTLKEAARGRVLTLNALVSSLASTGRARAVLVRGAYWTEIDTPDDLVEAEEGRRGRVVEHVLSWVRG